MLEIVTKLITKLLEFCTYYLSLGGPLFGMFLLILEAFIPILPLNLFVALNVNTFGLIFGITISWIGTCIGCFLCYLLFLKLSNKFIYKLMKKKTKEKVEKASQKLKNISLSGLVLLITLPFVPSFFINIVSGIVGISKKKFLASLLIGKFFMIIFWGYVGKSFLESLTDIRAILYVIIAVLIGYIISKLVSRRMNIE